MELLGLIASIAFALLIGGLIFWLGFCDYRHRRDENARIKAEFDKNIEWLKQQPEEVQHRIISQLSFMKEKK